MLVGWGFFCLLFVFKASVLGFSKCSTLDDVRVTCEIYNSMLLNQPKPLEIGVCSLSSVTALALSPRTLGESKLSASTAFDKD